MKRFALRIKAAATVITVGSVLMTQVLPLQAFAEDVTSPPLETVPIISVIATPVPVSDPIAPTDGSFLLPTSLASEPVVAISLPQALATPESIPVPVPVSAPVLELVPVPVSEPIPALVVVSEPVPTAVVAPVAEEVAVSDEEVDDEVVDTENESDIDLYKNFEGVVRQSTPVTCGPASLATLLSQLGDSTTEADVLQYLQVDSERGVNMLQLKTASEKLNHPAVLKHWSVDELTAYLAENADPILIHDVKKDVGGHFSVLREIVDGKVTLSDTEAGNITYNLEDFAHVYDGYVLIADPDASIAAIADESTNLSDADAESIWGKYVPVALAASRDGASDAAKAFKWCMERALTLTSATIRNNERKGCYIQLGQALATLSQTTGGLWADSKIAFDAGGNEKKGDPTDAQYSMGSNYAALVVARDAARTAASRANEQYQNDLTKPNPITDSNNVILGKKADLERQLDVKNRALRAANDQVSKAQLDLGNVKQQISASTSSLAKLSRSFQNKLSDLNARLLTKKSKLRSVTQDRDSWSAQSLMYQKQVNALCTNWYTCARNVAKIGALKAKKLYADGLYALNKILVQRAQQDVDDVQRQISSGGGTSAEAAALEALKQKQNTIEDDISRKQARIPGIQDEIVTINKAIVKLPALKTVPPPASKALYDAAALAYTNAVQAVADEKAFIDAQEGQLDSALTKHAIFGWINREGEATAAAVNSTVGVSVGMISGVLQGAYSLAEGIGTLVFRFPDSLVGIGHAIKNYDQTASAMYDGLKGRTSVIIELGDGSFISAYNKGVATGRTAFDACTVVCTLGSGITVKGIQTAKVVVDVSAAADRTAEIAKIAQILKEATIVSRTISEIEKLQYVTKFFSTDSKLQSVYTQHADMFGLDKSVWNMGNGQVFKNKILDFIGDSNTKAIVGTYRGTEPVVHYFNSVTKEWIITTTSGELKTGWILGDSQLSNLLRVGNVQ